MLISIACEYEMPSSRVPSFLLAAAAIESYCWQACTQGLRSGNETLPLMKTLALHMTPPLQRPRSGLRQCLQSAGKAQPQQG